MLGQKVVILVLALFLSRGDAFSPSLSTSGRSYFLQSFRKRGSALSSALPSRMIGGRAPPRQPSLSMINLPISAEPINKAFLRLAALPILKVGYMRKLMCASGNIMPHLDPCASLPSNSGPDNLCTVPVLSQID